ncbi:MAG: VWA domain-containing protein [Flavobacteriales bacterium]|nr:VWA domain-containing protein [Flavobacteriales bacterium]
MPLLLKTRQIFFSLCCACLVLIQSFNVRSGEIPEEAYGGTIDIVFVLDISGSTGGILHSVRSKFWEIQNEIARLDPAPDYRIGIVCMGRPSFKEENNYVQVISDLTDDIDAAAYPLFQIKDVTAPGNYFMGHALDVAVNELSWTDDPNAIKLMYLVGNGKPSAGPGFKKPLETAKEKGIIINSLYFLAYSNQKEQAEWKTISEYTGGEFFLIGLKEPAIVIEKPYDGSMLREANQMINTTYIYYGPDGFDRYEMQADLDEEAELLGENQVEARTFFKATRLYQGKNASWDLIDLGNTGEGVPLKQNRKFMDERYQEMSVGEFAQHLTEVSFERKEYVSIIKMLSTQREQFLREKREKMKNYRFGKTFFGVVNKTLIETAERYGYMINY